MKTTARALLFLPLLLGAGLAALVPAAGAARLFLKIEGPSVDGEAKEVNHRKWIEVQAVVQDVQNPTGSTPDVGRLNLAKDLDAASVELAYHAVSGTAFSKVTLEACQPSTSGCILVYRLELSNPRIVVVSSELAKKDFGETVAFDGFTQVTWTYYELDAKGQVKRIVTRTVPGY